MVAKIIPINKRVRVPVNQNTDHPGWTDEEWSVLMKTYERRVNIGRRVYWENGVDEEGNPCFSIFSLRGGSILNFEKINGEPGYYAFGPSRQTAYVRDIAELEQGFHWLDVDYRPNKVFQ